MLLSPRLSTAARLYQKTDVGADIGTDHALLPCHLLEAGICRQMLLCDISPKALGHARAEVERRGLAHRASLVCADGLSALEGHPCGCVSITGMGGDTMARMLLSGAAWLRGAALVLSPQTLLSQVRQAAAEIGYMPVREALCFDSGRYYQVWLMVPGPWRPSAEEVRYGRLLYLQNPELVDGYVRHRIAVHRSWLEGLRSAACPDTEGIRQAEADLRFYEHQLARPGAGDQDGTLE